MIFFSPENTYKSSREKVAGEMLTELFPCFAEHVNLYM